MKMTKIQFYKTIKYYLSFDPFKYRKDGTSKIRMFGFWGEACNKNTSRPLLTDSPHSFVERMFNSFQIPRLFTFPCLSVSLFLPSKTHRLAISWRGMERKRKRRQGKKREGEREGRKAEKSWKKGEEGCNCVVRATESGGAFKRTVLNR